MTRELRGRMRLLRAAWLAVVPILLVMDVIGFVLALGRPELLRNPQIERIVDSLGIPVELLITVALLIPFLVGAALGCLVFLRPGTPSGYSRSNRSRGTAASERNGCPRSA